MKKFYYKLGEGTCYTFGEIYASTLEEASDEIQSLAISTGKKFSVISSKIDEMTLEKWKEKEL